MTKPPSDTTPNNVKSGKTWNVFSRDFWKNEKLLGRKGLAIAGATAALGVVIAANRKGPQQEMDQAWADRIDGPQDPYAALTTQQNSQP